jgi:hypothetical protein
MDPMVLGLLIGLLSGIGICAGIIVTLAGGNLGKVPQMLGLAKKAASDQQFATELDKLLNPPPPVQAKPTGEAIRILTILQRESRLLDFLIENLQDCPDSQLGAAIRPIHQKAQAALKEHIVLEPVLGGTEGETVTILAGFDPSAIRLTGNVTGSPPFKGTLQHHGWRAKEIKIPKAPEGQDALVLTPAEVELG